jgi:serine/threonine protein kinase
VIEIGGTISRFEILGKLGEGGMGVVWKARDTILDRQVALKVLPADKVADTDRQRRFVQEAKAASALNHPNIVAIYDIAHADGIDFIVMEYVRGSTLSQLIPGKGLPTEDLLKYAIRIADALARAHGVGLVHRDLKPANIMLDDEGAIKVLDFGLAKLTEASGPIGDDTQTIRDRTTEGTIAGTVYYMSPEQAEGKKVEARSDIFAFGSVLYEMATGRRAFQGDTKLSTLAAILHNDPPPVSAISQAVPRDLEKVITRCLRKDPARRFQHMDDLKVALVELQEEKDWSYPSAPPAPPRHRANFWVSVVAITVAIGALAGWYRSQGTRPTPSFGPVRPLTTYAGIQSEPALSPDGKLLYFTSNDGLWALPLHGGDPEPVLKEDVFPLYAVAGHSIYYVRRNPTGLWVLRTDTGRSFEYVRFPNNLIGLDFGTALTVSSDERTIMYTQMDRHESNLMFVENFR